MSFYGEVRKRLANIYPASDFGPVKLPNLNTDNMEAEEVVEFKRKVDRLSRLKKEGYSRVRNKVKEIRSGYKSAVDKGTRSGSGRLVMENFDNLQKIWGRSPSVTSISNPHCSLDFTFPHSDDTSDKESDEDNLQSAKKDATPIRDTKMDKMKKKLSAHESDLMQIDLTKKELVLKKEAIEIMRENSKAIEEAIKAMVNSIEEIGNGIKDGLAMLANAMGQVQQSQNMMYMHPTPPNFRNVQPALKPTFPSTSANTP